MSRQKSKRNIYNGLKKILDKPNIIEINNHYNIFLYEFILAYLLKNYGNNKILQCR